jgi:uncharacterized membrane protein
MVSKAFFGFKSLFIKKISHSEGFSQNLTFNNIDSLTSTGNILDSIQAKKSQQLQQLRKVFDATFVRSIITKTTLCSTKTNRVRLL